MSKLKGEKREMKKAIVIGCSGAGKSTFSRMLRDKTGLPLYYLDMIWHKLDRTTVPNEEFDEKLNEILKRDEWILDGNYNRTLEMRLKECDTVFLFDFPTEKCLEGVRKRIGTVREDMPWVELEEDEEFMDWIRNFSQKQLPMAYELLKKYSDKNIVIFKSREDEYEYLAKL